MAPTHQSSVRHHFVEFDSSSDEILTVVVGTSGASKDFILPIDLVRRHAEKLKAQLGNTSSGGTPQSRHLYSIGTDENDPCEWDHLARLWMLGHSLESTSFKDAIVDAIVQKASSAGNYPDHLHEVLGEAVQQITGMRRLLVDIVVADGGSRASREINPSPALRLFYSDCCNAVDNAQGILYNMIKAQERLRKGEDRGCCWYHDHDHFTACYKAICPTVSYHVRRKRQDISGIGKAVAAIRVGSGADFRMFFAHTELLCRHSEYFAAALKPCWNQNRSMIPTIGLPDETSPSTFQIFLHFLAFGRKAFQAPDITKGPSLSPHWHNMAATWVLGDQIGSTAFKDAATDAVLDAMRKTFELPLCIYPRIYKNSGHPSGMRRLLVDLAANQWVEGCIAKQPRSNPEDVIDFFVDLAEALLARCRTGRELVPYHELPYNRAVVGCHYHGHGKTEPCYKTIF